MAQLTVLSSPELVEELAKRAVSPDNTDFSKVGSSYVNAYPLRASGGFNANDRDYVNKDGVIVRLNLPEQVMLFYLLSKKYGIQLRHGSLRDQLESAYSPGGQVYKKNVLVPSWVYTGEMIRKTKDGEKIGKVDDVEFLPVGVSGDHAVFKGETPKQTSGLTVVRYNLEPSSQIRVPTGTGYFNQFKGAIPEDDELKRDKGKDGRGYWNGKYFENDLSAVGCVWGSDERGLYAYANRPLDRIGGGVLGTWTDIPLNK